MSTSISTLLTTFNLPLRPSQISQWRGAVAESAGWTENDLFHNHARVEVVPETLPPSGKSQHEISTLAAPAVTLKDRYLYRYPLIQYRVIDGRAALFAVGEGVPALRSWLMNRPDEFIIGKQKGRLLIQGLQEQVHELKVLPQARLYRLMDYQALNQENYQRWKAADSLVERVHLLDQLLNNHLIGLAKGLDWQIQERFEARLLNLRKIRTVKTHGSERLAFNLIIKTRLDLPPGIAIGKAVSHGFGTLQPTREV
ncbi:MAG: CRISPR-associated endonuclease Cas6 [Bacteroidota bacterium]